MRALMPGSYDPVTRGHLAVIEDAARRYDRVTVAVFINPNKRGLFPYDTRVALLRLATAHLENVDVTFSDGMVADLAKSGGYDRIVKGIRNECDRRYELEMAEYNLARGGVPTELVEAGAAFSEISSTAVREALMANVPITDLVPTCISAAVLSAYRAQKGE